VLGRWINARRAYSARRTAVLIALAGGIGLLLLLGGFAVSSAGQGALGATLVRGGTAVVAAGILVLGLVALAASGPSEALALPVGPIRGRAALALDGLSAWFLLPVGVVGVAAASAALDSAPRAGEAGLPLLLAGLALCFAAADGALLLCGLGLVLLVAGWRDGPGALPSPVAAAGLLCFGAAFGLLGGAATEFATLRAVPPDGWRAAAIPFLGLVGAGAVATAALPDAASRPSGRVENPLLAAGLPVAAIYVLARLLPDLGGPAQPSWWGLPLLACGGAGAVAAALRAVSVEDAEGVPVFAGAAAAGLAAMALGAALVFRGADLGALAALAASGALLLVLGSGLGLGALAIVAAVVARSAGSGRLDRLGGLARLMPVTAVAALLAGASLALLPLFPGFAGLWALLQALVAGWRLGGAVLPLFCAAALALAGVAVAIGAAAMLRSFAVVFLGRPRTPRGAGARDVAGVVRWAMLVPVALLLPLGLVPGWVLAGGRSALAILVGRAPLPTRGAGLALAEGGAAYAPLLLAALLALVALAFAALVLRLAPAAGVARGPAWDGGFLAPPPHLPFGDPQTQPSAAGLAEPLRRMLRPMGEVASPPRRSWAEFYDGALFAVLPRRAAGAAALGGGLLVLVVALAAFALAGAG